MTLPRVPPRALARDGHLPRFAVARRRRRQPAVDAAFAGLVGQNRSPRNSGECRGAAFDRSRRRFAGRRIRPRRPGQYRRHHQLREGGNSGNGGGAPRPHRQHRLDLGHARRRLGRQYALRREQSRRRGSDHGACARARTKRHHRQCRGAGDPGHRDDPRRADRRGAAKNIAAHSARPLRRDRRRSRTWWRFSLRTAPASSLARSFRSTAEFSRRELGRQRALFRCSPVMPSPARRRKS